MGTAKPRVAILAGAGLLCLVALLLVGVQSVRLVKDVGGETSFVSPAVIAKPLPSRGLAPSAREGGSPGSVAADLGGHASVSTDKVEATLAKVTAEVRRAVTPLDALQASLDGNVGVRLFAQSPDVRLVTRFLDDEVRLSSGDPGGKWQVDLSVRDLPPATEIRYSGTRVEYVRGPVIEWYDNRADGLQQGFFVQRPFAADGTLRIEVLVDGLVVQGQGGDAVRLVTTSGHDVLTFGQLMAWDSRGRPLPAVMAPMAGGVALTVAAQDAVYPVTIDPLIAPVYQQVTASGPPSKDQFGRSVAISGDVAIVGAPDDDTAAGVDAGSAYVFTRSSGTSWTASAKLTAPNAASGDMLGVSVAISGETILVGAVPDWWRYYPNQGKVCVFVRSFGSWLPQAVLQSSNPGYNPTFGSSIAISGDTAVVGEPGANAAHVYLRSGSSWSPQARLTGDGAFGASLAASGDRIIVGDPGEKHAEVYSSGTAYIFERTNATWSRVAKFAAPDPKECEHFGGSVALSADTAIVGVPGDSAYPYKGRVFVYTRNGATWTNQGLLVAADGEANDSFGASVALVGDTAIVGAVGDDAASNSDVGSAYVFTRSGTNWTPQNKLTDSGGASSTLGASISMAGRTILIGAPANHGSGGGRAFFFEADMLPASSVVAPEFFVSDGATGELASAQATYEFGTAYVGGQLTPSRTVTISNLGTAALKGVRAEIVGSNASDFECTQGTRPDLAPNSAVDVAVSFRPRSIGPKAAVLRIFSNDADESPFDIGLRAEGLFGSISVDSAAQSVASAGGTGRFVVTSTTAWDYTIDADWVRYTNAPMAPGDTGLRRGEARFSYAVRPNTNAFSRSATITLFGVGAATTHTVTQSAPDFPGDTDGDGVRDEEDRYPEDSTRYIDRWTVTDLGATAAPDSPLALMGDWCAAWTVTPSGQPQVTYWSGNAWRTVAFEKMASVDRAKGLGADSPWSILWYVGEDSKLYAAYINAGAWVHAMIRSGPFARLHSVDQARHIVWLRRSDGQDVGVYWTGLAWAEAVVPSGTAVSYSGIDGNLSQLGWRSDGSLEERYWSGSAWLTRDFVGRRGAVRSEEARASLGYDPGWRTLYYPTPEGALGASTLAGRATGKIFPGKVWPSSPTWVASNAHWVFTRDGVATGSKVRLFFFSNNQWMTQLVAPYSGWRGDQSAANSFGWLYYVDPVTGRIRVIHY